MFCLDTNAVIAAINQRQPVVRPRLQAELAQGVTIGIPAIVSFELWYGIRKSLRVAANVAALQAFLTLGVTSWGFEAADGEEAGAIRADLERAGTPIGPYDVLIAAQARRRNAVLVTANVGEFSRVPGLAVANWTAA
jgi:tRNA(fMet)-specific endonuclease VapC